MNDTQILTTWVCEPCYHAVCVGLGVEKVKDFPIINFWDTPCGICGFVVGEYLIAQSDIDNSDALGRGDAESWRARQVQP